MPALSSRPGSRRARAATPAAKVDGRRTHIVDRALDYAALADDGLSASLIARKRRRSQGYVSIALRLGRAIRGMEPAELAALRSPRITWKLAQRIVRDDADAVSVRQQLRAALGGFSSHTVDRRRQRGGPSGQRAAKAPASPSASAPVPPDAWDEASFARDPAAFVARYGAALLDQHGAIHRVAVRSIAARGAGSLSVGQSIRALQRTLTRTLDRPAASDPAERRALTALAVIERGLRATLAEASTALARPAADITR